MRHKAILKLDPHILSSIKDRVGNNIKSSYWEQNLKVKNIALYSADSHTSQRWKKET